MLNCHDATQLSSDEQDRELTMGERMGLGMLRGSEIFDRAEAR